MSDFEARKRVLIAAGGTGGHLFPAQQLASSLLTECEVVFGGHGLSKSPFFALRGVPFFEVAAAPLKKGFLRATFKGFFQAWKLLKSFRPDVVVGFGSFHSFPLMLAAVLLRKKIVLFEANAAAGRVNRLFRPFATAFCTQFPMRFSDVTVPFLPWNREEKPRVKRREALAFFGLEGAKKTLLVFGGSQGAAFFNRVFPEVCQGKNWQVIHLTGKGGQVHYQEGGVCVKPFESEMHLAYAAADVVVCRAGASTIGELIRYQKSALLIPFPEASEDHQTKNAIFLAEKEKAARHVPQGQATVKKIREEIELLFEKREEYEARLKEIAERGSARASFAAIIRGV